MTPLDKTLQIRTNETDLAAWREAAQKDARPLAQWVRLQLNIAAAGLATGPTSEKASARSNCKHPHPPPPRAC